MMNTEGNISRNEDTAKGRSAVENLKVIPAPKWLRDRMEKLRKHPPRSIAEVRRQMQASADFRMRNPG